MASQSEHVIRVTTKSDVKGLDTVSKKLSSFGKGIQTLSLGMTALTAPVLLFGKSAVKSFFAADQAATKLKTNLKQVTGATDAQIESLMKQAGALQKIGVISDDVITAGQAELATYVKSTGAIEKLTPKIADLTAHIYGHNASAENMVQISSLAGKILNGNTGALSRYGFEFTEAQKAILETGNETDRVNTLNEVLKGGIGDINEALRDTPQGKMTALANDFDDFKEKVGFAIVEALTPLADKWLPILTDELTKLGDWIASHPGEVEKLGKQFLVFTGVGVALSAAGTGLRLFNTAMATASALKVPQILSWFFGLAGGAVAGGALVAGGIAAQTAYAAKGMQEWGDAGAAAGDKFVGMKDKLVGAGLMKEDGSLVLGPKTAEQQKVWDETVAQANVAADEMADKTKWFASTAGFHLSQWAVRTKLNADEIKDKYNFVWNDNQNTFQNWADYVGRRLVAFKGQAKEAAQQAGKAFAEWLMDTSARVSIKLTEWGVRIVSWAASAGKRIIEIFSTVWQGIRDTFSNPIRAVINLFKKEEPEGARAFGGPVSGGSPYLVGENGPEIFTPSVSGSINRGGGGGQDITVYQENYISQPTDMTAAMRELGWRLSMA